MAEIINLRQARKARRRAADETRAADNRVLHGRTKAERGRSEQEAAFVERRAEGHRLVPTVPAEVARGEPDET